MDFFTFVAIVISIIAFVKISKLQNQVEVYFQGEKVREKKNDFVVQNQLKKEEEKKFFQEDKQLRYVVANQEISKKEKEQIKDINEFHFGGNWLTIIGVVSVILGIGFFLDYSFKNNLISINGRIILGFISGLTFVFLGLKLRKKIKDYADFLTGAGFAILMLSAYFGLFYHLYDKIIAFFLMIIITILATTLAHKTSSKILATTGILAGFFAPILTLTANNEIILFSYLLLLSLGMAWLVWKHNWNLLLWGSFAGSLVLYFYSYIGDFQNEKFWIYWIFAILFFLLFTLTPIFGYIEDKKDSLEKNENLMLPILSNVIFIALSYFFFKALNYNNFYWVISLISVINFGILTKKYFDTFKPEKNKLLFYILITNIIFPLAILPFLQFSGAWLISAWFLEALLLAYAYTKIDLKLFLWAGVVLTGIGFYHNLEYWSWFGKTDNLDFIFNQRSLFYLLGIGTTFYLAFIAYKKGEREVARWLGVVGNLFTLLWIFLELNLAEKNNVFSENLASLLLNISYLIYGGILIFLGFFKKYRGFRIFGLLLLAFIILKTYIVDIWNLGELTRIVAFIFLGIFILLISFYYAKIKENLKEFLSEG